MEVTKREVEGLGARAIHACGAEEDEKEKKRERYLCFASCCWTHIVLVTLN